MNCRRSNFRVLLAALTLAAAAAAPAAAQPEAALAEQIQAQGGNIIRDERGQVVGVSLARTWATDADLERILTLENLQSLDLSLTYVSDAGIERLQELQNLREINLFAAEFITDAAIAFLRGHKRLERLNLRGTDVTDTSLVFIAEMTGLKALDISYTQISDVGLEYLAELTQLEALNLGGNKISGVGLHVLKLLPNLKTLEFHGIQRRNAGYCWAPVVTDLELDTISLLTQLEELNLSWGVGLGTPRPEGAGPAGAESECRIVGGIRITDVGLAKLAELKQLRSLDLSGSLITAAGLAHLKQMPQIERLSLWNVSRLGDDAAAQLTALTSLVSLDLSDTAITDDGLKQLARLSSLKRLYISDTKVTPEGLEAFSKARPDCWVSWAQRPEAGATSSEGGS